LKAVILAGGFGTRIREVANDIPKPMIQIGPYPILVHIMKNYINHGVNEFIICLGYKGEVIKNFFLNFDTYSNDFSLNLSKPKDIKLLSKNDLMDCKVSFIETGLNSMTGSRISKIRNLIDEDENFCLTYGDGVSNIDISSSIEFHKKNKKILTVTGVRPPGRFGEIEFNSDNMITGFNEKPQVSDGRISGGFFVANKKIFKYLNDDENLVFEQEPIRNIVSDSEMMIFKHDGFWQPMDTSRDFNYLNSLYYNDKALWI
jgi:glucose-1-phosphate cytidylyltransferase